MAFSSPQGFETRGTPISIGLTTWSNLLDSVSHLGPLTTNPLEGRAMHSLDGMDGGDRGSSSRNGAARRRNRKQRKRRRKQQKQVRRVLLLK